MKLADMDGIEIIPIAYDIWKGTMVCIMPYDRIQSKIFNTEP